MSRFVKIVHARCRLSCSGSPTACEPQSCGWSNAVQKQWNLVESRTTPLFGQQFAAPRTEME